MLNQLIVATAVSPKHPVRSFVLNTCHVSTAQGKTAPVLWLANQLLIYYRSAIISEGRLLSMLVRAATLPYFIATN